MQTAEIKLAYDKLDVVKTLFSEYRSGLDGDLCFKNYEKEVVNLPDKYILPDGRLYIIYVHGDPAGCIALRRFDEESSEMKRLYLRPEFRGLGLGYKLAKKVMEDSVAENYKYVLLDTLPSMTRAHNIYQKLGFVEIAAYYNSTIKDTHYMRCDLKLFANNLLAESANQY